MLPANVNNAVLGAGSERGAALKQHHAPAAHAALCPDAGVRHRHLQK